jgi:hypothetical protein
MTPLSIPSMDGRKSGARHGQRSSLPSVSRAIPTTQFMGASLPSGSQNESYAIHIRATIAAVGGPLQKSGTPTTTFGALQLTIEWPTVETLRNAFTISPPAIVLATVATLRVLLLL